MNMTSVQETQEQTQKDLVDLRSRFENNLKETKEEMNYLISEVAI